MFARSVNLRLKPNGVAGLPKTCLLICCDTSQSRAKTSMTATVAGQKL